MKMIETIIRQEKLDAVKDALESRGIVGMTVTPVNGRGRQKGIVLQWRAGEYRVDFLPKVKIEIVLKDEEYKAVIEIICKVARTGNEGDGMIFILPVEEAIRVRTGEIGEATLTK